MFRITVKSIKNNNILTYRNVKEYSVENGFVTFTDVKTGDIKRFSHSNTEIEEETR